MHGTVEPYAAVERHGAVEQHGAIGQTDRHIILHDMVAEEAQ